MSLDVISYNALLDSAYEGLQRLQGRVEKWWEFKLANVANINDTNTRKQARLNIERERGQREKEIQDVFRLFTEGQAILQRIIKDSEKDYQAAYQRGFNNGLKQGQRTNKTPRQYRHDNPNAFRAVHEESVRQAYPHLY